jgi:integrase
MALSKHLKPGLAVGYADQLVFVGKNSITPICYRKKWSSMTGMLRRPDLRVHDIRHWVAGSLLRNGVGVAVASQILGHRDQTMLLRTYGHLDHMSVCQPRCSIQLGALSKMNDLLCGAEQFEFLRHH